MHDNWWTTSPKGRPICYTKLPTVYRMHFVKHQALSAALGWWSWGGDCKWGTQVADLNHNCVVASISSYSCLSSYLLFQLSCIFSVLSSILDSYSISSIYCQPCSREHLLNLTVLTCQGYIAIDQYSSAQKWCLVLQLQNGLKIKGFKCHCVETSIILLWYPDLHHLHYKLTRVVFYHHWQCKLLCWVPS